MEGWVFLKKEIPSTAPAFSWTAHTAQGQTLPAAIVDMQIGAGTSPMSSYVAFTRVKKMEDLLIFRPFDRALFCQGNLEGPELLLKVLRGEQIDWQAFEEKHMPSHMCSGCDTKQFKAEFSECQWKRIEGKRYCQNCEKILSMNGARVRRRSLSPGFLCQLAFASGNTQKEGATPPVHVFVENTITNN